MGTRMRQAVAFVSSITSSSTSSSSSGKGSGSSSSSRGIGSSGSFGSIGSSGSGRSFGSSGSNSSSSSGSRSFTFYSSGDANHRCRPPTTVNNCHQSPDSTTRIASVGGSGDDSGAGFMADDGTAADAPAAADDTGADFMFVGAMAGAAVGATTSASTPAESLTKTDQVKAPPLAAAHNPALGDGLGPLTAGLDFVAMRLACVGGGGVAKLRDHAGSGYWGLGLLATKGRPLPVVPMALYVAYLAAFMLIVQNFFPASLSDPVVSNAMNGLRYGLGLVGNALFFLMTFRCNSAFQRWRGAGNMWDRVMAQVSAIARATGSGAIRSRALCRTMLVWSAAFLVCLKQSLRQGKTEQHRGAQSKPQATVKEARRRAAEQQVLAALLPPEDLAKLQSAPPAQRPQRCIQALHNTMRTADGSGVMDKSMIFRKDIEAVIPNLSAAAVAMQRVSDIVMMPLAYVSHTRAFLAIWLACLPYVLIYYLQGWTLLVCATIGYALLGMEDMVLEIECPYGTDTSDYPMDSMTVDALEVLQAAECKVDEWAADQFV
ncbi:hypothetical protein FOA52_000934 [Chlamydomonas sp. UWO 241]|nr:hypothetical protein FOA52_000934 [Chlamydomonas sp. UWO 241]